MKKRKNGLHPAIWDMQSSLRKGNMNRRDFMRFATLLGASAATATIMSACGGDTAAPSGSEGASSTGSEATESGATGSIKRGGSWTSAMELQAIDHPARLSWTQGANIVRQVSEYLTETGADNITRPYLLERWEANDDVTEWTLYLKKGINFNNGQELQADDVMFTIGEWLNEDVGSSMLGLLSYLDGMQSVEKVDDYTIKFHLSAGNIGVPEHLFHYPGIILPRDFGGDFIKQPVGTGPFTLEEYAEGERARFKRREDYWRNGADGKSLPYLDELTYISIDRDASVAAIQGGQVDSLFQPRPSDWQALKDVPGLTVRPVSTAQCYVTRMRVDLEPWTDVRVRNALKMCHDREKILQLAYFGEGDLSIDAHVAPVHPAYCEQPIPKYDPEGAKALLAEAGYPDGLTVTLVTKNDEAEPAIAQALKEMAAPAGFDLQLDITEPGGYWERWADVDLGVTAWSHRPLGTMVLALGYIADEEGVPVPWNETRWVDEEFSTKLREAEATLDVEARRKIFCELETIMQERGPIGNAFWKKMWNITRSNFEGVQSHPTSYDLMTEVWRNDL
ncbi:ABC transporter substrate-binding protein [Anaerolineales bacterium HSG6]|nr:ABC transporter substrate-binding protein [Anaerolineales bacterium HSG6]MDM8530330.1 ABC transporter substrate-binding protein [Anaerolineales bacterium HSG25]